MSQVDEELTFRIPFSQITKYDSTETMKALAGAPPGVSKEVVMPPLRRFLISTVGIFFLMVGLIGFFGNNAPVASFLWLTLGLAIIYIFIARPELEKRKKVAGPKADDDPEVTLAITRQGLLFRSKYNELKRDWPELSDHRKTKKGVHLNFTDNTEAYLPAEVFYDDELKRLMEILQKRLTANGTNG